MLIGTRIAHFRIETVLGSGGMGTVYRAYDRKLERPVALKLVKRRGSQKGLEQFLKEVRTVSNLNDPNIVTIHGFEKCDDGRFIVMELVEGWTLRGLAEQLADGDELYIEEIVRIGLQVAGALRVAHAAGIVHRDIKPENVMVRQHDRLVKLLDFGLARLMPRVRDQSNNSSSTRSRKPRGTVAGKSGPSPWSASKWCGTLRYMSPEQVTGRRLGSATDIFSFGVVLYELLTKQHPFGGPDDGSTVAQILERHPAVPQSLNPEIPDRLSKLVLSMLAKAPAERPDAHTVMEQLSQLPTKRDAGRPGKRHVVGRQTQLQWATDRLALSPRGFFLCITGEAGAGKTTFVEEFFDRIAAHEGPAYLRLRGRCEKLLAGAEAYLPVREVLNGLLRQDRNGSIASLLKDCAPGWYLEATAGAPDAVADVRGASPERMNREFLYFLTALSGDRPIVIFLDDVHWADVSTVYLLDYLAARADALRLFTVVTLRPEALEETHPFRQVTAKLATRDLYHELALDLLSPDDVRRYVDLEFPKHRFPQEFIELIHSRTEGNPLFMVDLLRDLRARNVITGRPGAWLLKAVSSVELPKRIDSLIEQKIAALEEADRALLSWAAVQGYEFDSAVLAKACGTTPSDVEVRLDMLERKHAFVRQVGEEELPTGMLTVKYRFTHVLYQNALYDRLSRTPSRRAELSQIVADALIGVYGSHRKVVASLLARLFEAARQPALAAEHFQAAAENAAQVSAHHEAEALLRRGLELLQKLPPGSARDERELAMQLALGASLMAMKGFAADAVREAYGRARQLCDRLGGAEPQIQMVLRGLWGYHLVRAEYMTARELAHSLYALAERANNHALLVEGHHALAFTLCHMGELPTAVKHRREALRLYSERPDAHYGFPFALDPGVGCRVEYAMDLWMLGYPDQARAEARLAREQAERLGHPYSSGFSLMFSAVIHEFCGDIEKTLEFAEQGVRLATEHGLKEVLGWSLLRKGWALAMLGHFDQGIALQRTVLQKQRELGSEIARPHFLGALAQSMLEAKQPSAALETVDEGLETVARTGARYYHAELLRLRGECCLALADAGSKPEDLFRQAAEISCGQDAKSFELRAAISLARLFAQTERITDARATLARAHAWFQEGFDTQDLREAKELLAGLG